MRKIIGFSVVMMMVGMFVGCGESTSTSSKVSPPHWLYGTWQPKTPLDSSSYTLYRFEEHDIQLSYVTTNKVEPFGSEIVDVDFYTLIEVSDSIYRYKLEGMGIAETVALVQVDDTTCVRSSTRVGQETFRDTLVLLQM